MKVPSKAVSAAKSRMEVAIFYCATCRSRSQLKIIGKYSYYDNLDDPEIFIIFGSCVNCLQPGLVSKLEVYEDEFAPRSQFYPPIPVGEEISYKVPPLVKESYIEAKKCASAGAWLATGVMVRRTLEAIGKDYYPNVKGLFNGLKQLKEQGIISEELGQWGEELRYIGNISAHPTEQSISKQDAEEAIAFVGAIIETIYHLRPKFQALKARRQKADPAATSALSESESD